MMNHQSHATEHQLTCRGAGVLLDEQREGSSHLTSYAPSALLVVSSMSLNTRDSDASTWLWHGSSVPSTTSTTSALLRRNWANNGRMTRPAGSASAR